MNRFPLSGSCARRRRQLEPSPATAAKADTRGGPAHLPGCVVFCHGGLGRTQGSPGPAARSAAWRLDEVSRAGCEPGQKAARHHRACALGHGRRLHTAARRRPDPGDRTPAPQDGTPAGWMMAGKPDPAVFAATTSPGWAGHSPLPGCRITGCGYALAGHGLCYQHFQRWTRAGRPDLASWQTAASPPSPAPATCRVLLHLVGQADLGVLPQPPQALAPGRPGGRRGVHRLVPRPWPRA